jgi:hypothetical protein
MQTRKSGTNKWKEYGDVSPYEVGRYADRTFGLKD